MSRLFALLAVLTLCPGCGAVVENMLRTTTMLSAGTTGGYRMLRAYDAEKQAAIQKRAKSGDPRGAEVQLNEYVIKRDIAFKALDAASVGVESGYAAVPLVGQLLDTKKRAELAAWISTLLRLGADVVIALEPLGIKVPGLPPVTLAGGTP